MRKVIIFDFDGTLANSFPWFIARINMVARLFCFNEVKEEDVPRLRLMSTADILKYLNISKFKLPFVIMYLKRLMSTESHQIHLFEGVEDLLKKIHSESIEIVVLSSNSEKNVRKVLAESSKLVHRYYCGARLNSKAKHFKQVIKNYPGARFLSVGDELRDHEAAQKWGIPHINVTWGYAGAEVFKGLAIVDSLEELSMRIFRDFDIKS